MGFWSDTFGGGNSFSESVANTFTPNDGASYVGGTLTYDSGDKAGTAVPVNSSGGYGSDNSGNAVYSGSANSTNTNANVSSSGVNESYNSETDTQKPAGSAPSGISKLLGFASPVGIIGTIAGWANNLDPEEDIKNGSVVDGRQVYNNGDMSYSYNFLGLPYEVKVVDINGEQKVMDSLKEDANGLFPGMEGYDQSTTKYKIMAAEQRAQGNDDDADRILQEEQDNSQPSEGGSGDTTNIDQIVEMAKAAGLVTNAAEANAIIADPMKFLEDRGMKLSDLIPTLDADAEGTNIDPNDPNYSLGENEGYDPNTVANEDIATVDDVEGKTGTTYDPEMANLTDNEMVDPVTGEIRDENLVDADKYTIDVTGAATGVNADGTANELGIALNDWANVDLSKVIDTSTTAGKLLADKLVREGKEFVDAKTSIVWQMKTIAAEFKDANGNPIIPPWAQAVNRDVMRSISFNGISGTAATAAMSNAIMESMMGVAEKEATFFQTLTVENLNNKQEAIINKAKVLSQIELANLDVRSQAAVQNAKAFLEMDLTNLSNEQQAEVINKQALVQALFDNTNATNVARRFGAEVANDMQKFYDELAVNIQRHNTSEINALLKFNAGEINDAAQFNADIRNDRQKFVAEMQYQIDLANAKWRQTVETTTFQAEFDAYTTDVKSALDLTSEQQAELWDYADNLLDYIWKTTDNDQERELRLLVAQMQAQSGQKGGSGFMEGLLTIGGAFLGSSSGSKWAVDFLKGLSDVRLKENIQHYDTLKGINFYTWDWNEEGKRIGADKYPTFGVLAQEVQKTHPEAVTEGEHGYLMVNYGMISNDV